MRHMGIYYLLKASRCVAPISPRLRSSAQDVRPNREEQIDLLCVNRLHKASSYGDGQKWPGIPRENMLGRHPGKLKTRAASNRSPPSPQALFLRRASQSVDRERARASLRVSSCLVSRDPPTRPGTLAVLLRPLPRYNKIVPNTPVSLLLKRKMSAPTGEAQDTPSQYSRPNVYDGMLFMCIVSKFNFV